MSSAISNQQQGALSAMYFLPQEVWESIYRSVDDGQDLGAVFKAFLIKEPERTEAKTQTSGTIWSSLATYWKLAGCAEEVRRWRGKIFAGETKDTGGPPMSIERLRALNTRFQYYAARRALFERVVIDGGPGRVFDVGYTCTAEKFAVQVDNSTDELSTREIIMSHLYWHQDDYNDPIRDDHLPSPIPWNQRPLQRILASSHLTSLRTLIMGSEAVVWHDPSTPNLSPSINPYRWFREFFIAASERPDIDIIIQRPPTGEQFRCYKHESTWSGIATFASNYKFKLQPVKSITRYLCKTDAQIDADYPLWSVNESYNLIVPSDAVLDDEQLGKVAYRRQRSHEWDTSQEHRVYFSNRDLKTIKNFAERARAEHDREGRDPDAPPKVFFDLTDIPDTDQGLCKPVPTKYAIQVAGPRDPSQSKDT